MSEPNPAPSPASGTAARHAPVLPRVLVVSLGGTIAMTAPPGAASGVTPRLTGADLLAAVPDAGRVAHLVVEDFRAVPGASLTVDDVTELATRVRQAVSPSAPAGQRVDGVVVTQGTDTIEETSYLLDLLYDGDAPVVVTGAMRHPQSAGADGPANLLAAVRTAAHGAARGVGVLVAFADELHAARHVRKVHSTSVAAFASPGAGPVGQVLEGVPRLHARPRRLPAVVLRPDPAARVEVVWVALGDDGAVLDGVAERADGLVVAGFGAGHVPAGWAGRLQTLAERMPVVLASRTGAGSVLASTYGFTGSESDLLARGLLSAGALDPYKARLLLLAQLRAGADRAAVAAAFAERG